MPARLRYPAYSDPTVLFYERFLSPMHVADNGGIVTGNPQINGRLLTTVANTQKIQYDAWTGMGPLLSKATFSITFKTGADVNSTHDLFMKDDSSAKREWGFLITSGKIRSFIYNKFSASFNQMDTTVTLQPDTFYKAHWVLDTSLGTNKVKSYINGVYDNGSAGNAAYSTGNKGAPISINLFPQGPFYRSVVGNCLYECWWRSVAWTAADVLADYNQNRVYP